MDFNFSQGKNSDRNRSNYLRALPHSTGLVRPSELISETSAKNFYVNPKYSSIDHSDYNFAKGVSDWNSDWYSRVAGSTDRQLKNFNNTIKSKGNHTKSMKSLLDWRKAGGSSKDFHTLRLNKGRMKGDKTFRISSNRLTKVREVDHIEESGSALNGQGKNILFKEKKQDSDIISSKPHRLSSAEGKSSQSESIFELPRRKDRMYQTVSTNFLISSIQRKVDKKVQERKELTQAL